MKSKIMAAAICTLCFASNCSAMQMEYAPSEHHQNRKPITKKVLDYNAYAANQFRIQIIMQSFEGNVETLLMEALRDSQMLPEEKCSPLVIKILKNICRICAATSKDIRFAEFRRNGSSLSQCRRIFDIVDTIYDIDKNHPDTKPHYSLIEKYLAFFNTLYTDEQAQALAPYERTLEESPSINEDLSEMEKTILELHEEYALLFFWESIALSETKNIKKYVYDGYNAEARKMAHDSILDLIEREENPEYEYFDFLRYCEEGNFEEITKPFYERYPDSRKAYILDSVFLGISQNSINHSSLEIHAINHARILEIFGEIHGKVIWDAVKGVRSLMACKLCSPNN